MKLYKNTEIVDRPRGPAVSRQFSDESDEKEGDSVENTEGWQVGPMRCNDKRLSFEDKIILVLLR